MLESVLDVFLINSHACVKAAADNIRIRGSTVDLLEEPCKVALGKMSNVCEIFYGKRLKIVSLQIIKCILHKTGTLVGCLIGLHVFIGYDSQKDRQKYSLADIL